VAASLLACDIKKKNGKRQNDANSVDIAMQMSINMQRHSRSSDNTYVHVAASCSGRISQPQRTPSAPESTEIEEPNPRHVAAYNEHDYYNLPPTGNVTAVAIPEYAVVRKPHRGTEANSMIGRVGTTDNEQNNAMDNGGNLYSQAGQSVIVENDLYQ